MNPTVILTFVFLVAVTAAPIPKADQLPPITEDMWKTSGERLKQIGLALHNYHDVNGHFPQNVTDAKGNALLSWRVLLLPYLEQDELFQQFKQGEAWDSSHNAKLTEKMPEVFAPVRVRPAAGQTFFQGFNGKSTLFEAKKKVGITQLVDGCSHTAMVVESGTSVPWSKPIDLPFDSKGDLPKLGGLFDGAFTILLADGSVVRVRKDANVAMVKRVIQINDGQPVDVGSVQIDTKR